LPLWLLLAALAAASAEAQTAGKLPVPVLLVMPSSRHVEISDAGLIGMLVASSINKASAQRAERFRTTLADPEFLSDARHVFGCFALAGPCAAPAAFVDPVEFAAAVRSSESQEGFVVELVPEQIPEQMLLRATARHVKRANDVAGTPIKVGIGYAAIYTTRAPPQAALDAYWSAGEPRRIVAAAHGGLVELNALFGLLLREGREFGPLPEAWQSLPTLEPVSNAAPRFACAKRTCRAIHIFEDFGDSVVLVGYTGNVAGWFDAAAAAAQADVQSIAANGIFWR
jgi:hypothetical protein